MLNIVAYVCTVCYAHNILIDLLCFYVAPDSARIEIVYFCVALGQLVFFVCVQVKSEKPEPILGVICATLCIAESAFKKRFADYQVLLERGQVMNAELLSNVVDVELIYSGFKYSLRASRVQPTSEPHTHTHTHPPTHTHTATHPPHTHTHLQRMYY